MISVIILHFHELQGVQLRDVFAIPLPHRLRHLHLHVGCDLLHPRPLPLRHVVLDIVLATAVSPRPSTSITRL